MLKEDPLSAVVALAGIESGGAVRFEMHGRWSMLSGGSSRIELGLVAGGACDLTVESSKTSYCLREGDCFLVRGYEPFVLSSGPSSTVSCREIFAEFCEDDGIVRYGRGAPTVLVCGSFRAGEHRGFLLDSLPPCIHLSGAAQVPRTLRSTLYTLAEEVHSREDGSQLLVRNLAENALIGILRSFVAGKRDQKPNWLHVLRQPAIVRCIRLIHQNPRRRWTLPELASAVGMSRSSLAELFKRAVGSSPMDYVLRWRMQQAAKMLTNTESTIATVAESFGYSSESAFSMSFKRTMQRSPSAYRKHAHTLVP